VGSVRREGEGGCAAEIESLHRNQVVVAGDAPLVALGVWNARAWTA
jgi:hypothetical protein